MGAKETIRRVAKSATAGVLHHTGLRKALSAYRRMQSGGRRIVIVGYHRIVEDFTGEVQRSIPGTLVSKETLRRQLEEVDRAGLEFATVSDALDVMSGKRRTRKDLFVVTFDDGYRDVYRSAYPILKSMGVPSMVYLPSGFIGTDKRFNHDRLFHLILVAKARGVRPLYDTLPASAAVLLDPIFRGGQSASQALDDFIAVHPGHTLTETINAFERQLGGGPSLIPPSGDILNWDECREMQKNGVDFGAHTVGHTVLTLQTPEAAEAEIIESKRVIERELGTKIQDFAYCNGWYSDELIRILARNGFRSGVTTEDYLNRVGGDPFTLSRKVLWENFSVGMLGSYSSALTTCQLDDSFGALGMNNPVPGRRQQFGISGPISKGF